jgi:nitrate reductase delta subunit
MRDSWLSTCYQIIGELLLNPQDRDQQQVESFADRLGAIPVATRQPLEEFLSQPGAFSEAEYVPTLELSPSCPLYLGAYLFDEPTTCRDVGTSGRNAYMLELTGIYRHFGFDLSGGELADYLPVVVDFLWISMVHRERDRIGLRRRFLEHYVDPSLEPLSKKLAKYESPYELLLTALQSAVTEDLRQLGSAPAWKPPADSTPADSKKPQPLAECPPASQPASPPAN